MKIIKYDWEDTHFINDVHKNVLCYDYTFASNMDGGIKIPYTDTQIRTSILSNKNIDNSKIVSFSNIFLPNSVYFLAPKQDKNQSLSARTNSISKSKKFQTIFYLREKRALDILFYVYFLYIFQFLVNKNVEVPKVHLNDKHSLKLKELNFIFKIGYSLNVLDIDPSVEINFLGNGGFKNLVHNIT